MTAIIAELDAPFDLTEPAKPAAPVLFNSPHSGRVYPPTFLAAVKLPLHSLRRSEDTFVDELFEGARALPLCFLRALFPRSFVDLNREPYELDPRMFDGRLPPFANTRSMRVVGGLGTIARVVGDAVEIYDRRLPVADALRRIETYYKPYHHTLRRVLTRLHGQFRSALLIDCHSMPSTAQGGADRPRADFVIGDRYGTSCAPALADAVEAILRDLGYIAHRNKPYAGGFITEHYGNPARGMHALQIEVNRGLYLDEAVFRPSPRFAQMQADMSEFARRVADLPLADFVPMRDAAE